MSFTTTYKGLKVDTHVREVGPSRAEPDLYCPNDDCPDLEVTEWSEASSPPLGNVATQWAVEVERVAWDGGYLGPTGPSYGSGGQPGEHRYPECPVCGWGGEPL